MGQEEGSRGHQQAGQSLEEGRAAEGNRAQGSFPAAAMEDSPSESLMEADPRQTPPRTCPWHHRNVGQPLPASHEALSHTENQRPLAMHLVVPCAFPTTCLRDGPALFLKQSATLPLRTFRTMTSTSKDTAFQRGKKKEVEDPFLAAEKRTGRASIHPKDGERSLGMAINTGKRRMLFAFSKL